MFWSKIFYGCKIISSKTGLLQRFSSKIFWLKIFYVCKIISSKTDSYKRFSSTIFGEMFYDYLPGEQGETTRESEKNVRVRGERERSRDREGETLGNISFGNFYYGCKIFPRK